MEDSDIDSVLSLRHNIDGVHLHSNGEETYDAISVYFTRNLKLCRRGYLNHLGVSARYRRKGIAKQLLSNVEKGLTKVGIKKEALFVLWTIHLRRNFTSIWAGMKKQL